MGNSSNAPAVKQAPWPVPAELPLYVSVERAAKIAGVSRDRMYEFVNSRADPIPQMRVGRGGKVLIRTAALPEYLMRRETA